MKLNKELSVLHPFINNTWTFNTSALVKIRSNDNIIEDYSHKTKIFNLPEYLNNCKLGIRRYLLKEKDKEIEMAGKRAVL